MADTHAALAHRALPFKHDLEEDACCPTMDVAWLAGSSTHNTHRDVVTLYRLSGATPKLWEWRTDTFQSYFPKAHPRAIIDVAGNPITTDLTHATFRHATWSPGQWLAVFSISAPSNLIITVLNVHTGEPVCQPAIIGNVGAADEKNDGFRWAAWIHIPEPKVTKSAGKQKGATDDDPAEEVRKTPAEKVIDMLPQMDAKPDPTIISHSLVPPPPSLKNMELGANHECGPDHRLHVPAPSLPCSPLTLEDVRDKPATANQIRNVLFVMTNLRKHDGSFNELHAFLGGTIYLGRVLLPPNVDQILACKVVTIVDNGDWLTSECPSLRLLLAWKSTMDGFILWGHVDFKLYRQRTPPSLGIPCSALSEHARISSTIERLIKHALRYWREIAVDWITARELGIRFFNKVEEAVKASGAHGGFGARWALGTWCLTGRGSAGLRDLIGMKSTERTFNKWENAMNAAYSNTRGSILMNLVPAYERLAVLIREREDHWFGDPAERPPLVSSKRGHVRRYLDATLDVLTKIYKLDSLIQEDLTTFHAFCHWFHYEIESAAYAEPGETKELKPKVAFSHLIAYQYISKTLTLHASAFGVHPIDQILDVNLTTDMESNLAQMKGWGKVADEVTCQRQRNEWESETRETLQHTVHSYLDWILGEQMDRGPPLKTTGKAGDQTGWENVVPYLATLALSGGMSKLFREVFTTTCSGRELENIHGRSTFQNVKTKLLHDVNVRFRNVESDGSLILVVAMIDSEASILHVHRGTIQPGNVLENAKWIDFTWPLKVNFPQATTTNPTCCVSVSTFEFFDDDELAMLIKYEGQNDSTIPKYALITIDIMVGPTEHIDCLPVKRTQVLSSHYVPHSIALNGRTGRRIGCVLAAQGRRLDVFDMESNEEDQDGEEEDEEANGEDEEMKDA